MAGFREDKQYFPLENVDSVVDLFKHHLEYNSQPNLALLSIVLGCIENELTSNRLLSREEKEKHDDQNKKLPLVKLTTVQALYQRFVTFVKGSVDLTKQTTKYATREFVKRVSDVIWSGLSRGNYQDKAHLQSLYSYLTGNKLDCFGVALGVVAACQVLGYNDVHLALSEDHAWVVYGVNGTETAEVTWHGKGIEDKRGQPIDAGIEGKSWLYLNGNAVTCDRYMEVAAMVASINPAINATMDSVEVARLQQDLLWLLYDMGHIERYPMALGTLGDLEELDPTPGKLSAEEIYKLSVDTAKKHYGNRHVYPYTYQGSFYYRRGLYKEALKAWAAGAEAISHYNYNRDDEEIYKEFLEIAHELLPHIVKLASDGYLLGSNHHKTAKALFANDCLNDVDFLKDPENFELILKFYDGICEWEEGSSTPVLHITWAKHFVFCISKFGGSMREGIEIERENGEYTSESDDEVDNERPLRRKSISTRQRPNAEASTVGSKSVNTHQSEQTGSISTLKEKNQKEDSSKRGRGRPKKSTSDHVTNVALQKSVDAEKTDVTTAMKSFGFENNNDIPKIVCIGGEEDDGEEVFVDDGNKVEEEKIKNTIAELASKVDIESEESQNESTDSKIADLAKACSESILNPDFLLGRGEPFTTGSSVTAMFSNPSTYCKTDSFHGDLTNSKYYGSPPVPLPTSGLLPTSKTTDKYTEPKSSILNLKQSPLLQPFTQSKPPETENSNSNHHHHHSLIPERISSSSPEQKNFMVESPLEVPTNGIHGDASSPISALHGDLDEPLSPMSGKLKLRSAKMKGLKSLLISEKLNTSAINLQLTAQSQVFLKQSTATRPCGGSRTAVTRKRVKKE